MVARPLSDWFREVAVGAGSYSLISRILNEILLLRSMAVNMRVMMMQRSVVIEIVRLHWVFHFCAAYCQSLASKKKGSPCYI